MAYYHDLITEKSWSELKNLHTICDFTLLGGWAVYLYTHRLKSKDIDILVDYGELPKLQKTFEFVKNDRLHKYEAIRGPVQIDIYTPHYSKLGIPVEILLANSQVVDGFRVVLPEYLILLKLFTLAARGRSPKGRKDFIDIVSLYLSFKDRPFILAAQLIHQYKLATSLIFFTQILAENTALPELSLNNHQFAPLKKSLLSHFPLSPAE
ncbi:MAG: hypothetical protein ACD_40C00157G0004 [uncultured bacterium]|nr:MAG: hypothetical protein ACD_40C00157G0004 [uncultured bacterium]